MNHRGMRVVLVQPFGTREGHFGLYTTKIAQHIAQAGCKTAVVCEDLEPGKYLADAPAFEIKRAQKENQSSWLNRVRGPLGLLFNTAVCARNALRLQSADATVIHLLDYEPCTALLVRALERPAPRTQMYLVIHPANFEFTWQQPLRGLYKVVAGYALRALISRYVSGVIVHGDWHRDKLIRQLRLQDQANKFRVVPYGAEPVKTVARRRHRLPTILFFGMLRSDKGLDTLFAALQMVVTPFRLRIVGAPFDWNAQEIESAIARLPAAESAEAIIRYIDEAEIAHQFADADVLVLPYVGSYVGGSGPLAVSASYGVPVIATDVANMGNLVRTHSCGLVCRPDDPEALARAIEAFLTADTAQRQQWERNAKSMGCCHTWSHMADGFVRCYDATVSAC